eukprot:TCONS_00051043-protein
MDMEGFDGKSVEEVTNWLTMKFNPAMAQKFNVNGIDGDNLKEIITCKEHQFRMLEMAGISLKEILAFRKAFKSHQPQSTNESNPSTPDLQTMEDFFNKNQRSVICSESKRYWPKGPLPTFTTPEDGVS